MKNLRTKQFNKWLILVGLLIICLFISSSMTYQQQSLVSWLKHYLPNKPGYQYLQNLNFVYGNKRQAIATVGYYKLIEFFIRKLAHFIVFGCLGLCTFLFLKEQVKNWHLAPWLSWFVVTGWAGFDEFHELLTGGRTPLIQDVILDSTGALTAILLAYGYLILKRLCQKHCRV